MKRAPPGSARRARRWPTHTAIVFFAGDRAYKVKKAVDLGFLDYTEPSARRTACTREVALNRRFAPDVYLGVGEVVSPGAEAPEPLVVMRRMPADRRLSALVRAGSDVDDVLRAVARRLSAWHAAAPHGRDVDEQGTRDALASRWEASFEQVRTTVDGSELDGVHEAERLVRRYLAGRQALFDSRIEQRRVVDGHGDLLAEDIFCLDDGPGSWTAWSSTTTCATSTGSTTPPSSPWTWNSSARRRRRPAFSPGTANTPVTRRRRPCGTTTSPIARS